MPNVVMRCPLVFLVAAFALAAVPAHGAAVQRTFVASNGNDTHPCSIVSPCRGFAAAIAQTLPGGEVIVLDSAGYGPATIAKSVSIIAPAGIYAGVTVSSGNGLTVNAGPDVVVVLRGLTINGQGGVAGINFTLGLHASLHVEDCVISGLDTGIKGTSTDNSSLFVTGTVIRENLHHGIDVAGFPLQVVLERVEIKRNQGDGVHVGDGPDVSIGDSLITHNGLSGAYAATVGLYSRISIQSSRITFNGSAGVAGFVQAGGTVALTVADSNISDNASAGLTTIGINGNAIVAARGNTFDNDFGAVYSNATGGNTIVTLKDNLVHAQNSDGIAIAGPGFITIAGNAISLNAGGVNISGGGVVRTAGNNLFNDNVPDVVFGGSLTPILLK